MRNTVAPGRGTWAALVRQCRGGMEITELARRLSVDRGTIMRWESGQTTPRRPDVVQRFATLFGLDLDQTLTVAGLRPATGEASPTPELRFEPETIEYQRMLDDPQIPEKIKEQIRETVRTLRSLAENARGRQVS